jgi:hypothetical protein
MYVDVKLTLPVEMQMNGLVDLNFKVFDTDFPEIWEGKMKVGSLLRRVCFCEQFYFVVINADPADGWLPSNDFSQQECKTEGGSPHHQDEDHHHHHHQSRVTDEKKDDHIELKSDLTETGSKSDLLQPSDSTSRQREQHIFRGEFDSLQQSQVEQVVRSVLDANFKETVGVRHVTCHFLQGKVVVELGVTLDNKLAIRDAMERAKDVERVLLKNVPDITTVQVQLSLSQ